MIKNISCFERTLGNQGIGHYSGRTRMTASGRARVFKTGSGMDILVRDVAD